MLLVFSADYLSIYDDETIMTDLELLEAIAVDKPCDAKSLKCVASGDHRAQTESIGFPVFLACVSTDVVLPGPVHLFTATLREPKMTGSKKPTSISDVTRFSLVSDNGSRSKCMISIFGTLQSSFPPSFTIRTIAFRVCTQDSALLASRTSFAFSPDC
jgi:hypothetical protein